MSILAQKADRGGVFEYVPNIRRPDAENFEHVAHVLPGGRDGVRQLDLVPGDLQLFAGRYSLHRVTTVEGSTTRYIGLPSYVFDPYRMNRSFHSATIYGRATELHHAPRTGAGRRAGRLMRDARATRARVHRPRQHGRRRWPGTSSASGLRHVVVTDLDHGQGRGSVDAAVPPPRRRCRWPQWPMPTSC